MSVKIRSKKTRDGRESLYLDIYHKKVRQYEFLDLYLISKPKNEQEKIHNLNVKAIADKKRITFESKLINSDYRGLGIAQTKIGFLEYFKIQTEQRKNSQGNYGNWDSVYKILQTYFKGRDKLISEITEADLNGIRRFISHTYKTSANKPLSANAQSSYFNKVKAAMNAAFDEKYVDVKIASRVKSLQPADTKREFLTQEEVQLLINTDCDNKILKRAFLFSCFTGLRWCDVIKLKWEDVQFTGDRTFIRYKQKKTGAHEIIDLNQNALRYLGEKQPDGQKVFRGLTYSDYLNSRLLFWVKDAGIKKHITFHCARHTFATLLLTKDIDIYTVSKLLGHRNLKTTQIYGKVIDKKRIEAINVLNF